MTVRTLAVIGISGAADGNGVMASFNLAGALAVVVYCILYVVYTSHDKIRTITPKEMVTTFAAIRALGCTSDSSTFARFYCPSGTEINASLSLCSKYEY